MSARASQGAVVAIKKSIEFSYPTGKGQEISCELLPIGPDLRAQWLIRCNGHERVFTYEEFVETGKVWVSRSLKEVGAS